MEKLVIITLIMAATSAHAAGVLQSDGPVNSPNRTKIQGFAPDGTKSAAVTALIRTQVDLTTSAAFELYCAADSKMRLMPAANSTRSSYALTTVTGGSPRVYVVNENTKFLDYSGACELKRD